MSEMNRTTGSTDAELDDDWGDPFPRTTPRFPATVFSIRELSWLAFNGRVLNSRKTNRYRSSNE